MFISLTNQHLPKPNKNTLQNQTSIEDYFMSIMCFMTKRQNVNQFKLIHCDSSIVVTHRGARFGKKVAILILMKDKPVP